jgi:hypothetical protein
MLLCKQVNCGWHLVCLGWPQIDRSHQLLSEKGDQNVQTASFQAIPAASLFSRFMATIDRWLMASARIAIRNGDLPHPGL